MLVSVFTNDRTALVESVTPVPLAPTYRKRVPTGIAVPDGAVVTVESHVRNVQPINTIGIAMGLHVRCGIEDNLWGRKGNRLTSVQQIEQVVRVSRELYREVATGEDARRIYRIGTQYSSADETLARLGYSPNRRPGDRGIPVQGTVAAPIRKAA